MNSKLCVVAFVSMAILVAGCGSREPSPDRATNIKKELDANEVLQRMIGAYKKAESYADNGQMQLSFLKNGQYVEQTSPLAVSFARPNKLSVRAFNILQTSEGVVLASDGQNLRYRVAHPTTGDMDNQFVVRPVSETLQIHDLYGDPRTNETDEILHHFMTQVAQVPVQLELLLSPQPLQDFLAGDAERQLLSNKAIDDHDCYRVEITTKVGKFRLWIDVRQSVLRRFEYPASAYIPTYAREAGVSDVKLVADLNGARLGADIAAESFKLPMPPGAKQVRRFVKLPLDVPTQRLGKRPPQFSFTDADGKNVTQQSLMGKTAVLVWFNNHPASESNLRVLDEERQKYLNDDRVAFYAVCTEPTTQASNQQLKDLLRRWRVAVPLVRDLEPHGPETFGVQQLPTLVILDKEGVLQHFEMLDHPNLQKALEFVVPRLLAGENLAAERIEEYAQLVAAYHKELAGASNGASGTLIELPETEIKPRTEPKRLKLTKQWTCAELTAPGNVYVVENEGGDAPQILVFDGWRTIVELNEKGKVAARHELDLPEGEAVSYLRTALDNDGNRLYVVTQMLGRQLHIFDHEWNRVLSYPSAEQDHPGIKDVQLFDLDGDRTPELYVGFWDLLGVQQVSLEGQRMRRNRDVMPRVLSLAILDLRGAGEPKLLVTDDRGDVVRMDDSLQHDPPISVERQPIHQIFAANEPARSDVAILCGLSYVNKDTLLAVGIDETFRIVWTHPLPAAPFENQIEFVTSGNLVNGDGIQWVIARADGSIHIKSDDGGFEDSFYYGETLTGVSVAQFGSTGTLLVATPDGVSAWVVKPTN